MANPPAPKKPQSPAPAPAKLKPLPFAFPFLRKGRGKNEASAQFTDEHEIYRLLAEREPSGTYLVSRKGMWHGGIHVTEAGAGQSLDLDAGLRCIADGVLIAFRANKTYPISEVGEAGSESLVQAPYSTGFALVQHTMEFPRGAKLTFYSLYMHLMSLEDYANFPKRSKPAYWLRQWRVTQYAQDKPSPGRNGQVPDSSQQGLRVRKSHPRGEILGILPQGASVSIGKREKNWGQVTDLHGASLFAPEAGGYAEPSSVVGGWVFLGKENGGPLVEEVFPDSMFDRVIVMTEQAGQSGDSRGIRGGIPIKAGDPIGHLGRYDSLNECTSGTRMAHIEVFCDDSIQSFLEQGRAWVNQHGPHKEDWSALGLPSEPTILRIAPGTVLYQRQDKKFVPGADPQSRKTDTVQVYSLAELARDQKRRVAEPHPNPKPNPDYPVSWWHVEGVNAQGQSIDGWVCDFNHPSGRVTREFAQKWIDFECVADTHDPAHTIFATTQKWVDYASGANVADHASRSNLSPLMSKVYDALFTKGDGKQAADELCTLSQTERGGYPWLTQAASRLIVKHESEWANPSKWKQLIAELEKKTGPKPHHEEEQKRIDKLAWWDEVTAGVAGFPEADVNHINPIGFVANFALECDCKARFEKVSKIVLFNEGGFVNDPDDSGGPTNKGIAWATWQAYAKEDVGVEPTLDNLKSLTDDQAKTIYLKRYWEPRGFCGIKNEKTALNIYDWTITSGKAIRKIQELLTSDYCVEISHNNQMSTDFVNKINSIDDQEDVAQRIGAIRKQYYTSLAYDKMGRPNKNYKFLDGWTKRVDRCLNYNGSAP
ncbi:MULTISPECIES: glycosyl hydrolase 108 family protein [unclassified Burkholderia]|uniref:glycosyl hydrolase 108 family protein n=1 Tax=unclassified Burkholderia TaxID=2613784 RepID=UPI00142215A9|nr:MULTISPECIES: glycosyl hydrolase 108 family protein [unclassified Burkholderia]NIE55018.1 glycoside hydrolase family 19 protein [Burkholderia sp. Ap-955]NIF08457.1 glycoside hydrolase family 19 protein [Burkholderia sp. Ax-1735]